MPPSKAVQKMLDAEVDLRALKEPGTYPGVLEKAALRLARAIHYSESTHCVTSWDAQKRAQDFVNSHSLGESLDELFRLEKLKLK